MKFPLKSKGSVLITLIATITVVSILSATLFSLQVSSLYVDLNEIDVAQAYYLARWGIRFVKGGSFSSGSYLTMLRNSDNKFYWIVDNSPPQPPHKIGAIGVRLEISNSGIKSTGIINEASQFEVVQTIYETN